MVGIIILLSAFATLCGLYCVYYAARAYKAAEMQKSVRVEDYIVECIFFLFSFIGVWVLQPRINSMADEIIATENVPAK